MPPSSLVKKTRSRLSDVQRKEICCYHKDHLFAKQQDIADEFQIRQCCTFSMSATYMADADILGHCPMSASGMCPRHVIVIGQCPCDMPRTRTYYGHCPTFGP